MTAKAWVFLAFLSVGTPVRAQDRMPEIPADKMTPAQKKAADEVVAARGGPLSGPFMALLRSPEVMLGAKGMGDYLRFKTVLPPKLREFVILIVARQWTQRYEWHSHTDLAMKAGLKEEIVKALAEGRRGCLKMKRQSMISVLNCTITIA